jgi:AcrR family transcriptional regulator
VGVTGQLGLRERKKQRTRQAIAEAAFALFTDRGFDDVTVAEVARRADVSEATVFNYFPAKEDLVFSRLEVFEAALVEAIRSRPAGRSVTGAFGELIRRPAGLLATNEPEAGRRLAAVSRIVAGSPALRRRERQVYDDYTHALAGLIAEETAAKPTDIEPWVVANALIGVHRSVVEYVRAQVLAGRTGPALARRLRVQVERALAVLDRGLAGYGVADRGPRVTS